MAAVKQHSAMPNKAYPQVIFESSAQVALHRLVTDDLYAMTRDFINLCICTLECAEHNQRV